MCYKGCDAAGLLAKLNLIISSRTSSIMGIGCTHFLAHLISKCNLTSPVGLGTTTAGFTDGVGPLIFSMMSALNDS